MLVDRKRHCRRPDALGRRFSAPRCRPHGWSLLAPGTLTQLSDVPQFTTGSRCTFVCPCVRSWWLLNPEIAGLRLLAEDARARNNPDPSRAAFAQPKSLHKRVDGLPCSHSLRCAPSLPALSRLFVALPTFNVNRPSIRLEPRPTPQLPPHAMTRAKKVRCVSWTWRTCNQLAAMKHQQM